MINIINDIKKLNGAHVHIFGQPVTLDDGVQHDELVVDILDILENLREYEMDLEYEVYNEDLDEYDLMEFKSCDDYLNYKWDIGEIKELNSNNSYNWGGYFNHEINYNMYEDMNTGDILVELKVHRYGDVRSNYTDTVLLSFQDEYEFLDIISERFYNEFTIDNVDYSIEYSGTSEDMEVYKISGDYITTLYGCSTVTEARDEMIEYLQVGDDEE